MAGGPFDSCSRRTTSSSGCVGRGELLPLEVPAAVDAAVAGWARGRAHDPGCRVSLPFAFGTTGYLCDGRAAGGRALDRPAQPPGRCGSACSPRSREVVGAALIALGPVAERRGRRRGARARELLLRQRPQRRALRQRRLRRARRARRGGRPPGVERPGGRCGACPPGAALRRPRRGRGAVDHDRGGARRRGPPDAARALLPELATPSSRRSRPAHGYATPNAGAWASPAPAARRSPLFPSEAVLRRCHVFRDLGRRRRGWWRLRRGDTRGTLAPWPG